jgi:hypothetical protein
MFLLNTLNQGQGDKNIGENCQFLKSSQNRLPCQNIDAKDQIESPKHLLQATFKTLK